MKVTLGAVSLRSETAQDLAAIRRVNTDAFGRTAEANLVDVLRRHWQVMFSLVAEADQEVVGHVLLTQVTLLPARPGLRMLALGPVAVLPEFQRQGIGSRLIREAVAQATADGWHALVVLGAPEFYTRFGFAAGRQFGLASDLRAPADQFMVLELQAGILAGLNGVVQYQPQFSGF